MENIKDLLDAKRYITNIRDENYVILDGFKKEIKTSKDKKTHFSTLIYDTRIKGCNTILEALEKQIPKKVKIEKWEPVRCPSCGEELSESIGDGYYRHWAGKKICDCGQKLDWEE